MSLNIDGEYDIRNINQKSFENEAKKLGLGKGIATQHFLSMVEKFEMALEQSTYELEEQGYGVAVDIQKQILKKAGINPDIRVKDLTDEQVQLIRNAMEGYTLEGDLRREVALNIKRLVEIGSYRGIRHRKGLPLRGQKTKTNARTRKGPKKTIANKKK